VLSSFFILVTCSVASCLHSNNLPTRSTRCETSSRLDIGITLMNNVCCSRTWSLWSHADITFGCLRCRKSIVFALSWSKTSNLLIIGYRRNLTSFLPTFWQSTRTRYIPQQRWQQEFCADCEWVIKCGRGKWDSFACQRHVVNDMKRFIADYKMRVWRLKQRDQQQQQQQLMFVMQLIKSDDVSCCVIRRCR
jgi:hypothetical protein